MAKAKKSRIHPISILRNLTINRFYGRLVKENQYLKSLHYNLRVVGWDDFPIYPDGFAGNASFLYFIFKILYREKPKSVLELGSGQSTLFTSKYAKMNQNVHITILEENKDWQKRVKSMIFKSDNIRLLHSKLIKQKIGRKKKLWYSTKIFDEENRLYDFIIVDGPVGTYRYSRLGICKYILDIIDPNNFIIIFDDTARKGEVDTIKYAKKLFRRNKIDFIQFHLHGTKRQTCLVSKNKEYLAYEWTLY